VSIGERAQAVRGELDIVSDQKNGTRIRVRCPAGAAEQAIAIRQSAIESPPYKVSANGSGRSCARRFDPVLPARYNERSFPAEMGL